MAAAPRLNDAVQRPGGDPALRGLALFFGAACAREPAAVGEALAAARGVGCEPARLHAAALQVVPFAGFPRAIEALGQLAAAGLPAGAAPAPPATAESARAGRAVFDAIYGAQAESVLAGLQRLAPGFGDWVLQGAYARVLAGPGLTLRERELLAVAALALMSQPAPLESHLRGALRNGSSVAEATDILATVAVLAAPAALTVLDRAVQRLSRSSEP